jgi:phospholipase/carboxylesterase
MRAWYDILGADLVRREDETGLRQSIGQVHALIEREIEGGVPADHIVLAGFSQGCAITLAAGLRFRAALAGLAGMSGYVPLAGTTEAERQRANAQTPVFLAHGRRDGIVTLARGEAGRDLLLGLGQPVEWHDYPMEHSVCAQEIDDLQNWLVRVIPRR